MGKEDMKTKKPKTKVELKTITELMEDGRNAFSDKEIKSIAKEYKKRKKKYG
jgi:hypothetical protein